MSSLAYVDTVNYLSSASDPTIGDDGTVYVTDGTYLLAYSVANDQFTYQWGVDCSAYATNLSAPTIDTRGSTHYAWMGATKWITDGSELYPHTAYLVRVNLDTQAVTGVNVTDSSYRVQGAAHCPPAVDSDGTFYVASRSETSSGGASLAAVDGSMNVLWVRVMPEHTTYHTDPVSMYSLALEDGGVSGTHHLYVQGNWTDYVAGVSKRRYSRINATLSGGYSVGFEADLAGQLPCGNSFWYSDGMYGYPVISNNGSYFYFPWEKQQSGNLTVTDPYLEVYTSGGSYSSEQLLSSTTFDCPAIKSTGTLVLPGATITPSIDASDNVYMVNSNGTITVTPAGGSAYTISSVGATGQIAIRDTHTAVVRIHNANGDGLALLSNI